MKTNIQFLIISRSFLLRMRNASENSCRKSKDTHFMLIFSVNHAMCEIMWKNMVVEQATDHNVKRGMPLHAV